MRRSRIVSYSGRGTTTYTITEFSDDSFTTVNPMTHAGLVRWVRAKTNRYFLTFAARRMPLNAYYDDNSLAIDPKKGRPTRQTMGGPAFAMWTKIGGSKTEVETLGIHFMTDGARTIPVVGPAFITMPSVAFSARFRATETGSAIVSAPSTSRTRSPDTTELATDTPVRPPRAAPPIVRLLSFARNIPLRWEMASRLPTLSRSGSADSKSS